MTARTRDTGAPTMLLVGGAGAIPLGVDVAVHALRQARSRGMAAHQANKEATVAQTPAVAAEADRSWSLDFEQPEACAAWARERVEAGQRFDVVLGVREFAQLATADIAAVSGAPGNPPEAVRTVRNKDLCRAALAAGGFQQPSFALCADLHAASRFVAASSGPWVVKPRDAMGSEGVRLVSRPAELAEAVVALPGPGPFIVEQFVTGREYSVEGVFLGGEPHVLAVTEKHLFDGSFVEAGHVLPAPLPDGVHAQFAARTTAALRLLGLRYGIFHVELWHGPDGVVLGEVHVRNGGDWIHLLLQHAIPGLELFGCVYDDVLGRPVRPASLVPRRAAAVQFLTAPPGRLERVDGWDAVADHPSVLRAGLTVEPGSLIGAVGQSTDRVGEIVVGADTPHEAAALARKLAGSVTFAVAGG